MRPQPDQRSRVWAVTSFFPFDDPPGTARRLDAYRQFRKRLRVPLVAVELSQTGDFRLGPADAEILVQIRGGALLWQKERLLNLALDALPPACDTVAWLDCDIAFEREDWPEAADRLLEDNTLVQLFGRQRFLDRNRKPELPDPPPSTDCESAAARWRRRDLDLDYFRVRGSSYGGRCQPGVAWAARRSLLERHGFYDAMVMGATDKCILAAACGRQEAVAAAYQMSPGFRRHYLAWADRFHDDVRGRLGFLRGTVYHFWHGDLSSRGYSTRYRNFERFDFRPETDLSLGDNGAWEWAGDKPELEAVVLEFFEFRRERQTVTETARPADKRRAAPECLRLRPSLG